jgi:hypothetical protein
MKQEEIILKLNQLREKHNFQTIRKELGEKRIKQFFKTLYPKHTIPEIEKIIGIPDSTIGYWFKELKIPSVRHRIATKTFPGKTNSKIVISNDKKTYIAATIKITPELAYVIGFTLGDGSVQKYQLEVFNKDRKLKGILYKYLEPYGTITTEERSNGLWRLRLSNGAIASLIKDEDGIRKDTIKYIFKNDNLAKQFIAAFWDAEGSVLKQRNYCHLYVYNSNKYLIDKICEYLQSKRINYSIHSRKTRSKLAILGGRLVVSRKDLHRISVHKCSLKRWVDSIGINLNHTTKSKMVCEIVNLVGGN